MQMCSQPEGNAFYLLGQVVLLKRACSPGQQQPQAQDRCRLREGPEPTSVGNSTPKRQLFTPGQ